MVPNNPVKFNWLVGIVFLITVYVPLLLMYLSTVIPKWPVELNLFLVVSLEHHKTIFKIVYLGLPWWCSGWKSACQCRGHRFDPWSRKIPHAAEQLSPRATTTEPACHNYWSPCTLGPMCRNYWARVLQLLKPASLEPALCNKRSHCNEKPMHRKEE